MTTVEPDEVHEIDPEAALDLTGDELVDEWRGVNVEDAEEVTGGLSEHHRMRGGEPGGTAPEEERDDERDPRRHAGCYRDRE